MLKIQANSVLNAARRNLLPQAVGNVHAELKIQVSSVLNAARQNLLQVGNVLAVLKTKVNSALNAVLKDLNCFRGKIYDYYSI